MFSLKKPVAISLIVVIFLAAAFFVAWRNLYPAPSITTVGWQTMHNDNCGITYPIPTDWTVTGYLGESKILSPQDQQQNAEWDKSHQILLTKSEGEVLPGPDARSLYISCQPDLKSYLHKFSQSRFYRDFANKPTLAEVFASNAFQSPAANPSVVQTVEISGLTAYELKYTVTVPGIGPNTTHEIVVEQAGQLMEIELGQLAYQDLSDTVKQIIDGIQPATK